MDTTAGTAPARPVDSGRDLFVRNATGLVRELTAFDAFNLIFAAVLIPVGITQTMGFTPMFWPHANMLLAFLIATPLVACFGLVYLYFTVLMPRSGGDYVWVSRTLNPFVGFVVNFSLTFVFLTWVALNFAVTLFLFLPGFAYVAGITNTALTAPSTGEEMLLSTIFCIATGVLMLFGVRVVARYMAVTFAIVWIGIVVWMVLMLIGSHSGFITNWNQHAGTSYSGVLAQAKKYGFLIGGIGLGQTLLAMVYCFQVFTGFQWTGYFAGEIKNVRRTARTSIIGGLIASAAGYMIGTALIYKYYGFNFFGSLVFMGLGGGSAHSHIGFTPYLPALVAFLPGPKALHVFVAATFVLAIFWWAPAGYMLATRNVFAWSFDRLAPSQLTEVSERFHTPVIATAFITAAAIFICWLGLYQGFWNFILNIIVVMGGAFVIVSLSAAAIPWLRPTLFEEGPEWGKFRIAGIPVITLAAIVSAASWAFVVYAALSTGFSGTLSGKPMMEALSVPAIAIIWYAAVWMYRRSQGINLSRTFQEIPPE